MRVLQVVPSLIKGGAERLALNIADELEKLGHEVLVASLRDDNRYPELNTDKVRVVNSSVYYSAFGSDQIRIEEFEALIDNFKPNIIHSHLLDSELVSRHNPTNGIAYITHWHGCPSLTNPVPFAEKFSKEYVWKWNTKRKLLTKYQMSNTHFLCISKFIQNYVVENLGVKNEQTTVIHNAIDLGRFKPLNLEKKTGFRLVSIGSLQRNKNHQFLFRVVRKLLDDGLADVYLDVYGEGPEKGRLQQVIERLNLQENVTLHGIVSDPEAQINQAHLLVHSAWHEPFGLIFIEAMACGIPVVSFNTGGPAEMIDDSKTGYLVEKDDLNGFVNRIKQFYQNRELIDSIGKNGIAKAKNFDLEQYVKKIEALYQERLSIIR